MSTVILTEAAAYEVKSMMQQNGMPEGYLRISVKGGGCTGLSYGMSAEESPSDNDEVHDFYDVKVLVDKADAPILKGTTVDFKQSLMGAALQSRIRMQLLHVVVAARSERKTSLVRLRTVKQFLFACICLNSKCKRIIIKDGTLKIIFVTYIT